MGRATVSAVVSVYVEQDGVDIQVEFLISYTPKFGSHRVRIWLPEMTHLCVSIFHGQCPQSANQEQQIDGRIYLLFFTTEKVNFR